MHFRLDGTMNGNRFEARGFKSRDDAEALANQVPGLTDFTIVPDTQDTLPDSHALAVHELIQKNISSYREHLESQLRHLIVGSSVLLALFGIFAGWFVYDTRSGFEKTVQLEASKAIATYQSQLEAQSAAAVTQVTRKAEDAVEQAITVQLGEESVQHRIELAVNEAADMVSDGTLESIARDVFKSAGQDFVDSVNSLAGSHVVYGIIQIRFDDFQRAADGSYFIASRHLSGQDFPGLTSEVDFSYEGGVRVLMSIQDWRSSEKTNPLPSMRIYADPRRDRDGFDLNCQILGRHLPTGRRVDAMAIVTGPAYLAKSD